MAIEVGNIFEGRVTGVKPFGAFVALPEGRVGMVHISEVSNEYVQDIAAVLHDGDTVKVQVINVAPDGKIALSIKRLLPPAPRAPREGRGPRPNNNGPREGGFRRNGQGGRPQGGRGPARDAAPRVWQPKAPAKSYLSFLGLGVAAPMPSLGSLATDAVKGMNTYPVLLIAPALMISIMILVFNLFGDGLRDAFDPKLKS